MSTKDKEQAPDTGENEELTPETAENSEQEVTESAASSGNMGKIFLLVGMILVQAGASYAIVSKYYSDIYKKTQAMFPSGGVYYQFDNILINPADSDGERFLLMSLVVELADGNAQAAIEKREAEVQDRINLVLGQRKTTELNSISDRERIKKDLAISINKVLEKNAVQNLFFTKYVLQ